MPAISDTAIAVTYVLSDFVIASCIGCVCVNSGGLSKSDQKCMILRLIIGFLFVFAIAVCFWAIVPLICGKE